MHAILVKDLFEVSAKTCAFERLGEEITLEGFIFQVITDIGEALLAVLKCVDERLEREHHLALLTCICGHMKPHGWIELLAAVGAGSAGCLRFSFADGKPEKSRKSRSPA